jgi:hypothetical protein
MDGWMDGVTPSIRDCLAQSKNTEREIFSCDLCKDRC